LTPRSKVRDTLGVIALAVIGIALIAGYATWRVWSQGQVDGQRPADAVVVMGAAQYNGRPSPVFQARIDHAIELFKTGVAPLLVVTGGKADGDLTTEAASARAYAIARGVPSEAILAEDRSRTTLESIRAVGLLMREHGLDSAVFVSDRPHMLRVLRMAADDGIAAYGSPTTTSPIEADPMKQADATVHELLALAQYFLVGGAS
jgi:uncharacterized SAM-binding protein YcdF (DUF218 family)